MCHALWVFAISMGLPHALFMLRLNVVNAVFVQQTMKTASSDEELAFKQKERDISAQLGCDPINL